MVDLGPLHSASVGDKVSHIEIGQCYWCREERPLVHECVVVSTKNAFKAPLCQECATELEKSRMKARELDETWKHERRMLPWKMLATLVISLVIAWLWIEIGGL